MSLLDAATALIELLDQYECDEHLAAARSALNAAVTAELLSAGTVVASTPGKKRGPTRRLDYQAIRDAVAANDMLPPDQRRTRDEIAAAFGTSAVTVRKAMRLEKQ